MVCFNMFQFRICTLIFVSIEKVILPTLYPLYVCTRYRATNILIFNLVIMILKKKLKVWDISYHQIFDKGQVSKEIKKK